MKLDNTQKILLIALIITGTFIVIYLMLRPFFTFSTGNMMSFMTQNTQQNILLGSLAAFIAVGLGFLSTYLLKPKAQESKQNEIEIVKKALSQDEKKVIEEIQKAGEITQDSLRFRLNWSKAKISAILSNLDRLNLIQRQRQGKTYNVFIQENGLKPSNKQ